MADQSKRLFGGAEILGNIEQIDENGKSELWISWRCVCESLDQIPPLSNVVSPEVRTSIEQKTPVPVTVDFGP